MKTKNKNSEERALLTRPAMSKTEHSSEDNASTANGPSRREFLQTVGLIRGAAAAVMTNMVPGISRAADLVPDYSRVDNPYATGRDYSKIPQRLHKYPASERAKQIVHKSITMGTLFSGHLANSMVISGSP
ncbi:MAG: twin-arginine translocation signal domain-containing protein [Desulfobacteraceae bacterium]|jgi:hypothetical protein|nr:twin-arginine translocation signal domain-containing protein [Desulfobacteraceae bacterium]